MNVELVETQMAYYKYVIILVTQNKIFLSIDIVRIFIICN